MSSQKIFTKARVLFVSVPLLLISVAVPTNAHATDCKLTANAQLPICKNANNQSDKAGLVQEVPQDAAWAQKNAAQNAPQTNGAPKGQGKAKRQWTHTVQAKCTRGGVTLNLTEGATCPQGFKKK